MWNYAFAKKSYVLWPVPPYFAQLLCEFARLFIKIIVTVQWFLCHVLCFTVSVRAVEQLGCAAWMSWTGLSLSIGVGFHVCCKGYEFATPFLTSLSNFGCGVTTAGRRAVGPRIIRQMRCQRHGCVTPRGHRTASDCIAAQSHWVCPYMV